MVVQKVNSKDAADRDDPKNTSFVSLGPIPLSKSLEHEQVYTPLSLDQFESDYSSTSSSS